MAKNTNWKKFYDRTAVQRDSVKDYRPVKVIGKNGVKELVDIVQKNLKDGMKIIDVGCGTGGLLMDVYRTTDKKVRFFGIDNSPGMIKVAKEKFKGIKDVSFVLKDALKTGFNGNTFDMVINRLGAGPKSYKETYRILKKNGLFIMFITDNDEDWKEIKAHFGFKDWNSLKEQVNSLKEAGFKAIKIQKFKSTEYYRNLESLAKMIEIVPFRPTFDRKKDLKKLKEYGRKYKTRWGIKSSHRRIVITSKK